MIVKNLQGRLNMRERERENCKLFYSGSAHTSLSALQDTPSYVPAKEYP